MCRFAAYSGPEILISSLVTDPKHSIIHQSYDARERVEPLNGDGYGIGWYAPQFNSAPAIFKEVSPAWNSQNLINISRVTKSGCIFAHVRAATIGGHVSRANCHPFCWNNYLFMHNGTVFEFDKIKRLLRMELSDESYEFITGNTDSEHLFALFIDRIKTITEPKTEDLVHALLSVILRIKELKQEVGIDTPSTMNLVLSDGSRLLTTRYISRGSESDSLYYTTGKRFYSSGSEFSMEPGEGAALIVSEPLNDSPQWKKVPNNSMVIVEKEKTLTIQKIFD